jgi:putative tryptophan/tyrosine transport system substrate-binding protein
MAYENEVERTPRGSRKWPRRDRFVPILGDGATQFGRLKRRRFITLLGGAAVAWPFTVSAQRPARLPTIGFLGSGTPSADSPWTTAFVQRLRELGWIEGRTVAIEYRWGGERGERYAAIAAELVRREVDVIVTAGTQQIAAAKQATAVVPIVFAAAGDPIGAGLVASLARPGGNVTGLSVQQTDLASKRLELLREAIPGLLRLAILINVDNPATALDLREVQAAARTLGLDVIVAGVRRAEEIAPAVEGLNGRADALYIATDPLVNTDRIRIGALALEARLPTMCGIRECVEAGGLLSYGPNIPGAFRRAAEYVDKILRGTKPADIPVEQPTKFDLTINLATAKALGLRIPDSFLIRAEEMIE